jgi:biotin carboxylase
MEIRNQIPNFPTELFQESEWGENVRSKVKKRNEGILIVSGGILQIPALEKARELGLTTHLMDGSVNCKAKDYADHFHLVDTKDIAGAKRLACDLRKQGKINSVYTQGADVEYTVACAASAAGLPGINPAAALNCKNKIRMREILRKHKIDKTPFARASNIHELSSAIRHVGFPCYVKPSDNSASRGISRLAGPDNLKSLETTFQKAAESCFHSTELIVEAEILGPEFSVDTVLYRGKLYPAGISDRVFLRKKCYAVQAGSVTPSNLPDAVQVEIYRLMAKAARALGITDGAFKGDLVVDQGEPKIIEVTARTSGGFDSQYRKPYSFGIDILKATMDIARGLPLDPLDLIPQFVKWSKTFSIFPSPGGVKEIRGLRECHAIPGVRQIFLLVKPGDVIEPYTDCSKRSNHIIIAADTPEDLRAIEARVCATLKIITKEQ